MLTGKTLMNTKRNNASNLEKCYEMLDVFSFCFSSCGRKNSRRLIGMNALQSDAIILSGTFFGNTIFEFSLCSSQNSVFRSLSI